MFKIVSLIALLSPFLNARAAVDVDFACRNDYIAETHRLNDLYLNGEESKNARTTLKGRSKREKIGTIAGLAAAETAAAFFLYPKLNKASNEPIWAGTLSAALGLSGAPAGMYAGRAAASKETKASEKSSEKFLTDLKRLFDVTEFGYNVVSAAKVVVDRDQYLPEEVEVKAAEIGRFLRSAGVDLLPSQAADKIIEADMNGTLCPNHDPMTSDELAYFLKQ